MKVHKTNRLFYRKYPYKVECGVKGAEYAKRYSLLEVQRFCDPNSDAPKFFRYRDFTSKQRETLAEFAKTVKPLLSQGHQVRAEMNTLSFYLEDRKTYENIHKKLEPWVKSITEPESEKDLETLFSKNHITVCNKLPHGKYGYKVMISNNLNPEQREKLMNWMENYGDTFKVPEKTALWLRNYRTWCYEPYFYVESSKQLMMLHLYLGDKIKRTYEFVLRNTPINSVSEDEL